MLKYVSKFFLEIFPSVIATVVGAYIVNQYIIPKAGSDKPKAAAYSKDIPSKNEDQGAIDITPKPEAAPAQEAKDRGPDKTQDSKGTAAADKTAADRASDKRLEKPVEAAKEAAKTGPDTKRAASREKATVKNAAPPPVEAAPASDERRDANELARAAIERLRTSTDNGRPAVESPASVPGIREPARELSREPSRANVVAPLSIQSPSLVQPLPPPVVVKNSTGEGVAGNGPVQPPPPYAPATPSADTSRLTPPADIPSRPLDLQAAAAPPSKPSVAADVLSAARSVINAVVPQ